MKASKDEMKAIIENPKFVIREVNWGSMHAGFESYFQKTDFTGVFDGLPQDMCQCPHWGYVITGTYKVRYSDSYEETYKAGDAYYMPPGHTPEMDPGSEIIEFSPMEELSKTMQVAEKNFPGWLEKNR